MGRQGEQTGRGGILKVECIGQDEVRVCCVRNSQILETLTKPFSQESPDPQRNSHPGFTQGVGMLVFLPSRSLMRSF